MTRALIVTVLAAVVATILLTGAGGDSGTRYKVVLDNSFGLTEGVDLKAAGVRVGSVEKLDVQRSSNLALVTVKLERQDFAGFRKDVFCEVKPQSLIGEYFLDCQPGKSPQRLASGATIPVEQTAGTIPADLVQNILRRPAGERFGLIFAELGIAFAGRAQDVQDTIVRAVPALRETDKVLKILGDNRDTLQNLTRESDAVLARLAGNRDDVARFVAEARDTASASASRHDDLAETVRKLPDFLRELRPTLRDLGTVADKQTPALVDLRASADDLTELFDRLGPFSEASRPAVRSLGRASVTGRRTALAARDTVSKLRTLGAKAKEPLTNLRFVLEYLDDRNKAAEPNKLAPEPEKGFSGLEAFLQYPFVQSQAINIFDSQGYMLKLNALINQCGGYTNAETARAKPERTKACSQALGPNQPGVNTAVEADQTTTTAARAASRSPRATPRRSALAATPAPRTDVPARQPRSAPQQRSPAVQKLLDKVLPGLQPRQLLPRVTSRLPGLAGSREDRAPDPRRDRALLDFLLGS